jgi:tetratricopeptide (TPR) repeat protein
VTVGDKPVPAGAYALFTIPGKTAWTVILSKNLNGSPLDYKKEGDVLRLQATAAVAPARERLAFLFSNYNESSASLDLEWEKLRVSIPIKAHTDEQAAANVKTMTETSWRPYTNAARYMLEQKKDYDAGLSLVDKSLSLKEEWLNVWTKAQLLAAKGKYKDALPLAEKAAELGKKSDAFFFEADVKKALTEWKGK